MLPSCSGPDIFPERDSLQNSVIHKVYGGNRNAWHKQIDVVYMSPPESRCTEVGMTASLWVYNTIFIPLSGTTWSGLGARNVMGFSSLGLGASC